MRLLSLYGLLLALCVIGLSVVSCKSGGDPSTALVIESISPSGIVGKTGDSIEFSAVVTGATGTLTYAWSFGGGGTADDAASPTPNLTLGRIDQYTGSLTVTDTSGLVTAPFTFEVVDTPVIQSVSPTGRIGTPGDVIQLSAVVSGVTGTATYAWTFGGGGIADDESSPTPNLTLGSLGDHTGSLRLTDANGFFIFPFTFEIVDFPVVQSVTPSGSAGLPLGAVEFSAEVLGNPTNLSWTFTDGALPAVASGAAPSVTLQNPGNYSGQIVATNGNGDSEPFFFSFTVDQPVAPTWTFVKVGANEQVFDLHGLNMQVVNEKLVLAYNKPVLVGDFFDSRIRYTRALTAVPTSEADFISHSVTTGDPSLSGPQTLALAEDGTPYFIFGTGDDSPSNVIRLARATSPTPGSSHDWVFSEIESGESTKYDRMALARSGSHLMAIWLTPRIRFAYSNDLDPAGPADWTKHQISESSAHVAPYIMFHENRIYISSSRYDVNVPGTLRLFWTDEELPTKEADWGSDAVQVYPTGVSVYSQLFAWQGKPVVVALASGQTSHSEGELHFAGSNTPDFLDYITTRITPAGFYMPNYGGLVYRNRIAALFGDPAAPNLFLARQVAVDPTLPDKWDLTPIAPPGSSAAHPATMVLLGDKLVVAFCDATDGRLTLAITDSDY